MTKTFAITSAIALGVVLVGTGIYAFWPREVDCGGGAVAGGVVETLVNPLKSRFGGQMG